MKILFAMIALVATATTVVDLTPGESSALKSLAAKRDAAYAEYRKAADDFDKLAAFTAKAHKVQLGFSGSGALSLNAASTSTTSVLTSATTSSSCLHFTDFDSEYKHIVVP